MTIMGAFGGYTLKLATSSTDKIYSVMFSKWFYIGGMLYVTSALLNIYVLKLLPYTVVLPLTSITYIWTLTISYFLLNEKITKYKIIGIIFIMLGALFISI
ncbi:EamA family transporter [Clostridium sp. 19966]|nr:EamA family transporter [Clostridium sp. 19966]